MNDIPKPPERGNKSLEDFVNELSRWAHRIYDALRYLSETGGSNDNDNV